MRVYIMMDGGSGMEKAIGERFAELWRWEVVSGGMVAWVAR